MKIHLFLILLISLAISCDAKKNEGTSKTTNSDSKSPADEDKEANEAYELKATSVNIEQSGVITITLADGGTKVSRINQLRGTVLEFLKDLKGCASFDYAAMICNK
jgi:hypothetical protein